jgi:putative ABC transport system ATP-binding protein
VNVLELHGVTKQYPSGNETVRAVDNVSLKIAAGEFVALYGPSGAGKSTLLMLAAGLIAPDKGRIIFDRQDVSRLSPLEGARYRRRDVGFVFQSFHLMSGMSALDNATMKLFASGYTLREARRKARPWIERVGLTERSEQIPERLSMGERQRVAIARALTGEPRLLLADEPTGNLDSVRTREIFALLRDICQECGIPGLLVTHDLCAMSFAARVYTLRDGRLVEGLDAELAVTSS